MIYIYICGHLRGRWQLQCGNLYVKIPLCKCQHIYLIWLFDILFLGQNKNNFILSSCCSCYPCCYKSPTIETSNCINTLVNWTKVFIVRYLVDRISSPKTIQNENFRGTNSFQTIIFQSIFPNFKQYNFLIFQFSNFPIFQFWTIIAILSFDKRLNLWNFHSMCCNSGIIFSIIIYFQFRNLVDRFVRCCCISSRWWKLPSRTPRWRIQWKRWTLPSSRHSSFSCSTLGSTSCPIPTNSTSIPTIDPTSIPTIGPASIPTIGPTIYPSHTLPNPRQRRTLGNFARYSFTITKWWLLIRIWNRKWYPATTNFPSCATKFAKSHRSLHRPRSKWWTTSCRLCRRRKWIPCHRRSFARWFFWLDLHPLSHKSFPHI